jgi:UDP-glucose 4-epimerase
MKKKALVSGGLGFIGSHVAETLYDDGFEVLVVDDLSTGNQLNEITGVKYLIDNVVSSNAEREVMRFKPDYLFHLAALPRIQPSFEEPIRYNEANINATVRLLDIGRQIGAKAFIYSSSASVYGNPLSQPITESTPVSPLNPYAVQKYAAEQLSLLLGERWRVPVVALRYFNPFGERSYYESNNHSAYSPVIGIFETWVKQGKKLEITGDGSQRRDFIYVKDVAWANLLSAQKIEIANQHVFNVCSGTTNSIIEIAEMFTNSYTFIPARSGEAQTSWGCKCFIKQILGWDSSISVSEYISKIKNKDL